MKKSQISQIVESRYSAMEAGRDNLISDWSVFLGAVDEHYKNERGNPLSMMEKRNLAQCLENAAMSAYAGRGSSLLETTDSGAIEFMKVQLPVIAALLPSLVMNEVGITQTLDRRQGAIFYLDVKTGQKKGAAPDASTLIGAKTGHAGLGGTNPEAYRTYGASFVSMETIVDETTTDSAINIDGTVDYPAVFCKTVKLFNAAGELMAYAPFDTAVDASTVTLASVAGKGIVTDGAVFGADGTYTIEVDSDGLNDDASIYVSYSYNFENLSDGVPEVDIDMDYKNIEAVDFPLRAKFTMRGALDAEKAHGFWNNMAPLHRNVYSKVA